MPGSAISLAGLPAALRAIASRQVEAAERACHAAAQDLKTRAVDGIRTASPRPAVDTGELLRSYRVTPLATGRGFATENVAPHAAYMEHGVRPGRMPPFAPLFAWAMRKLRGRSSGLAPRRPGVSRQKAREDAARALATGTQRAIRVRGIEGRHFHAKATEGSRADVRRHLLRELGRLG